SGGIRRAREPRPSRAAIACWPRRCSLVWCWCWVYGLSRWLTSRSRPARGCLIRPSIWARSRPREDNMVIYIRWIVLLALAYLALTSNLELANIVVGLLLAAGVVLLVRPEPRPLAPRNIPQSFVALVRYLGNLISDLVVSGIQVARIVVSPDLPIH